MRCPQGTQPPMAPLRHPDAPRRPTHMHMHMSHVHLAVPGSPEMGVTKPRASLPFTMEVVGTYSCHGVEPGMRQGETSAKINPDPKT